MYPASLANCHRIALAALAAGLLLLPRLAPAEPQAPSEGEIDDANFGQSFIGKVYEGELDIDGWTDFGGGLVVPPVYIRQYQREDGTFLVLTSRQLSQGTRSAPASYVVADALIVPRPPRDVEFSISCVQPPDETLRFMGLAKGPDKKEWWTNVRQAWEISIENGQITTAKTRGIRCTNIGWGQ